MYKKENTMKYNIHIAVHDPLKNPSRIIKESHSLIKHNVLDRILILGKYDSSLPVFQDLENNIQIIRLKYPPKLVVILKNYLSKFKKKERSTTTSLKDNIQKNVNNSNENINLKKKISLNISRLSDYIYEKGIERAIWNVCKKYNHAIINTHTFEFIRIALNLSEKLDGKAIYDAHELESQRIGFPSSLSRKVIVREMKYLPRYNGIFVVGQDIKQWYMNQYLGIVEPVVVRNIPLNSEVILRSSETISFREKYKIPDEKIILLYNGGLSKERGIDLILNIFSNSELNNDFVCVFMGYGPMVEEIKTHKQYGDTVYLHPAVPPSEVLAYTQDADMGFSILYNNCLNHNYALPNKLFEYMSAGIGVIGGTTETQKKFIVDNGIGICSQEETVEAYIQLINNLTKSDIKKYKNKSQKLRQSLSWEQEVIPMINEYKRIIQED